MEVEAVAAILQVLVQNLIDHSKKEISLIRGLDKDAAKLAQSLEMIQDYLNDAEMHTIPGGAVKSWLKKLEDAAFDADNILDELNYHLLSKQIKPIKPIKEKVLSCFSSFNHIARPRNMAIRIQEINENLESLNKEATELGLVGRLANVPTLFPAAFETDSFTGDRIFFGRDNIVSELVEILATTITTGDKISILAIVGMGGLGKTTLTRKVFHHQKKETQFGSHIWVHVSQNFDPIILFKKIVKELTSHQVEVESRQYILKKLEEALRDKTYLLVLDDVWNEDLPKWENFIKSLLGVTYTKGNAIVVTTRNMKVASTVSPLHTHQLRGLSEEDCWSIIKAKSSGNKDFLSEFETIGRKIARRCQGLPLAANVVGGVLRNISEEKWLSIEEKWISRDEGDSITKILRLSFDNLSPPSLKKCFAYCSVFPKGKENRKQALIEYWMAEGFLQDDGSSDMESVGNKFINVLVQNSLLQVAIRDDYGDIKVCQMHDLVHDLASSVLCSSNNINGMRRVRYMTHEDQSSPIPKEVAKYLRTLSLEGEIFGNVFSDFECLHVLAFGSRGVIELPSSIRKMIHLRNLDISTTSIKYMPDWIGELLHLQTLKVDTFFLEKLPCTVKYLVNLRHLYIDIDVELPAGIGRLTSLQTLTQFTVGDKNGCKIEELGSLTNLTGQLKINKLERVAGKEEAEKANLCKKSKIRELSLRWDIHREGETRNDENVLEGLQPHPNLNKLSIVKFRGKIFPAWSEKMTVRDGPRGSWVPLNKLVEITLFDCQECEDIPMLGHLPNLKSVVLGKLSKVKCIKSSFYGLVNKETRIVFPALVCLYLVDMPKLVEWAGVE